MTTEEEENKKLRNAIRKLGWIHASAQDYGADRVRMLRDSWKIIGPIIDDIGILEEK